MSKTFGPPSPRIPSRGVPTLRGKLLDDATIRRYILAGHYGPEMRKRQEEWEEYTRKEKRTKKDPLADARKMLESLL